MTTPHHHRLPTALAAALCLLAAAHSAQAADTIGSASISIDNLRYRLIDLDPNDGIAPAVLTGGGWIAAQATDAQPAVDPGGDYLSTSSNITPVASAMGGLLTPGTAFSSVASDGSNSLTVGANNISLSTVLRADGLLTGTVQAAPQTSTDRSAYIYTDGQWQYGTRVTTTSVTQTISTGSQGAGLLMAPAGTDPAVGDPSTTVELTLTPHTLLVIDGYSSASISADSSFLSKAIASLPEAVGGSPYYEASGHYVENSVTGNGFVAASLRINVNDSPNYTGGGTFGNPSSSGAFIDLSAYFDSNGFATFNPETYNNEYTSTYADQVNENWSVQYANAGDAAKTVVLQAALSANISQYMQATTTVSDATFTPDVVVDPVIPDPGTGTIPEPSTYALMGLGLAGIALVRRRRPT